MDPLKPFSSLIRSALTKTPQRAEIRDKREPHAPRDESAATINPTAAVRSLESRLRTRIHKNSNWSPSQVRKFFIETVLAGELGHELINDPEFANVVNQVSDQLEIDPALSARLDALLKQLSEAE